MWKLSPAPHPSTPLELTPGPSVVLCAVSLCVPVLSLHIGKAAFLAWTRVDLWLPALPTANPWTTALAWWTPRHRLTAWRPPWWTAPQVTWQLWLPRATLSYPLLLGFTSECAQPAREEKMDPLVKMEIVPLLQLLGKTGSVCLRLKGYIIS